MKPSIVVVAGTIVTTNGQLQLRVSGSNDLMSLIPDTPQAANANAMEGKVVVVEGTLVEASKGRTPDTIRYRTITEDR
jgi:hypothetical protein